MPTPAFLFMQTMRGSSDGADNPVAASQLHLDPNLAIMSIWEVNRMAGWLACSSSLTLLVLFLPCPGFTPYSRTKDWHGWGRGEKDQTSQTWGTPTSSSCPLYPQENTSGWSQRTPLRTSKNLTLASSRWLFFRAPLPMGAGTSSIT